MINFEKDKTFYVIGYSLFLTFTLSLFLGLLLNEDASGIGTSNDFNNTWEYVERLKNNYFFDGSEWTRLLPFHFIFLSVLHTIFDDIFIVRLIFCSISIFIPILFFKNLVLKYGSENKGKLLIISSLILLLPFFRSSAIWPNPHILSFLFLLISIFFFQKCSIELNKKINLNLILHIIFLSLAIYTRRYYVFLFIYYIFIYYKYLKPKEFVLIIFFIFLLSVPGFILIFKFPYYVESSGYSLKFYNSIPVISSIFLLYVIPFLNFQFFKIISLRAIIFFILSVLSTFIFAYYFDYNPRVGGGIFMKISNIFIQSNYLFFLTSLTGFYILLKLVEKNKENLILIFLVFLTFSNNYMLQKYFEPLWFIILFLILDLQFFRQLIKTKFQVFFVSIYFLTYSISALLNSYYKISLNYFW